MHNVFGLNMVRATHEGVSKLIGNKRPFILSRAGFCGLQRYAASWTGDNTSNYKHLALQIPMFLNMGLSGTPFIGSDIGGFFGSPDGELLTRWYQASVLVPLMRTHTCRGTYDQEPWVYGEPYLSIIRKYINLRYSLVPYLYSCFYEASKHGVPILRPLIYEYQNDPNTYTTDNEFLVGRQILVAPVVKEATKAIIIYLPTGNWYDYYNKEIIEGHKSIHYDAPLEVLPIFIKEGSVIAKKAVGQYTGEKPINTLTLEVYPLVSQNSCDSILYIDDGKTKDSPFSLFNFKVVKDGKNLSINISKEGEFNKLKGFKVKVFSPPPKELILNGQSSPFKYAKGIVFFSLDKDVKKVLIKY
jgi:alpha-glucosidase